jgi:hypothetical protein
LLNFSLAFGSMMITNDHGSRECENWPIDNDERAVTVIYDDFFFFLKFNNLKSRDGAKWAG